MKHIFIIASFLLLGTEVWSQSFASPQIAFNKAANEYIFDDAEKAVITLNHALKDYPGDKKLRDLLEKILKDRQQEQEQKQENKDNKENQENKEEQQQDQEKSEEEKQKQEQQEQQEQQSKEEERQKQEEQQSKEKGEEDKSEEEKQNQQQAAEEKEGEEGDKENEQQIQQNLQELNISPEKARMILEALKNNEVQYIQQMQRKSNQPTDDGKPDW